MAPRRALDASAFDDHRHQRGTDMKAFLVAAFGLALTFTGTARASDVAFSLHGERSSEGQIDGVLHGLKDNALSQPASISLTVTPYHGDFLPFSESFFTSGISSEGSLMVSDGDVSGHYGFADNFTRDYLRFDIGADTFDANLSGEPIFLTSYDGPGEGGYITFAVLAAPEPRVWLLLALGIGGIGEALRRWPRRAGFLLA